MEANSNALRALESVLHKWTLVPCLQRDLRKDDYFIRLRELGASGPLMEMEHDPPFLRVIATGQTGDGYCLLAYDDGTIEQFKDDKQVIRAIPRGAGLKGGAS